MLKVSSFVYKNCQSSKGNLKEFDWLEIRNEEPTKSSLIIKDQTTFTIHTGVTLS